MIKTIKRKSTNLKLISSALTVGFGTIPVVISCGSYLIRSQEQIVINQPLRLPMDQKWSDAHSQWQYVLPTDQNGNEIYFDAPVSDFLIWLLSLSPNPEVINQIKNLNSQLVRQGQIQAANYLQNLANRVESQLFGQMVNNQYYWHWKQLLNLNSSALEVYWQDFSGLHIRQNQGDDSLEATLNRFLKTPDRLVDVNDFNKLLQVDWQNRYFIWLKLDLIDSARWVINGRQQQNVQFVFHIKPTHDPQWKPTLNSSFAKPNLEQIKSQTSFVELRSDQAISEQQPTKNENQLKALNELKWLQSWLAKANDSVLDQELNQPDLKLIKQLKNELINNFFNLVLTKTSGLTISEDTLNQVIKPLFKSQFLDQVFNLKLRLKINNVNSNWTTIVTNQLKWNQAAIDLIKQLHLMIEQWKWDQANEIKNHLEFEWQLSAINYRQNQVGLTYLNQTIGIDQNQQPVLKPLITYVPFFTLFNVTNDQKDEKVSILDPGLISWSLIVEKGTYPH